jgi:hypothetical protein
MTAVMLDPRMIPAELAESLARFGIECRPDWTLAIEGKKIVAIDMEMRAGMRPLTVATLEDGTARRFEG